MTIKNRFPLSCVLLLFILTGCGNVKQKRKAVLNAIYNQAFDKEDVRIAIESYSYSGSLKEWKKIDLSLIQFIQKESLYGNSDSLREKYPFTEADIIAFNK